MIHPDTLAARAAAAAPARKLWETPRVRRLDAGSAEAGPNPNTPEGAFAFGSS